VMVDVEVPPPAQKCSVQRGLRAWWAALAGSHTALLLCRKHGPRDIDGQWLLATNGRRSDAQALQVAWSSVCASVLTIGLGYAFEETWQPLLTAQLPDALVQGGGLRAALIVAATAVCSVAAVASRLVFYTANSFAARQRMRHSAAGGQSAPQDGPRCTVVAAILVSLGWVVCLGGALASLGAFAFVTHDLQMYERTALSHRVIADVGAALGGSWVLLEPLALGLCSGCAHLCCRRKPKAKVAAEEDNTVVPAEGDAAITNAATDEAMDAELQA